MKTSPTGIELMHHFESCKLEAYPDPKTGGEPWTIGWGHTGTDVWKGLRWTQAHADYIFICDLERFEKDVMSLVKVPLTQGQFDALVSFSYNCGSDIDDDDKAEGLGDSTLLKLLNKGDYEGARDQLIRWVSKGTSVEKGLTRRRRAEMLRWDEKDWRTYQR